MPLGYQYGNPFGDPNGFNKHTGADEVDRFNQWLRATPEYQQIKGTSTGFDDARKQQLANVLQSKYGVNVPGELHIDDAGNFNQSRTAGDWTKLGLKGAAIGGLALTGLGAAGIGPMSGLFAGSAAAPALGGGESLAANLGSAGALGASGATGATSAGAGAVGFGSKLAGLVKNPLNLARAGATGLSAASNASAQNRGAALAAAMDNDRLALAREQNQREATKDAMHNLAVANYVGNYQAPTRPAYLPASGLKGPTPPSDAQKQAAKLLEQEMLARLNPATQFQLTDKSQYMKPGAGEKWSGYVGAGLAGLAGLL